jgi:hypothetical protein
MVEPCILGGIQGCAIAVAPTTEPDVPLLLALSTFSAALSTCFSAFPVACMQKRPSQSPTIR